MAPVSPRTFPTVKIIGVVYYLGPVLTEGEGRGRRRGKRREVEGQTRRQEKGKEGWGREGEAGKEEGRGRIGEGVGER